KLHRAAELPAAAIGYLAAATSSPDYHALTLLAGILAGGRSSRLYRTLVHEGQIAAEVDASVDAFADPGLFTIFVRMQPGKAVEEAEREIYGIVEEIAAEGVTEEELEKAKNMARVEYVNGFKTHAGTAMQLAYFEVVFGGYRKALEQMEAYGAVTRAALQQAARRYLGERSRTVVVLVPEKQPQAEEVRQEGQ
ncbi:MAG: insulinase family protein, partial [Bacteroidota bacterium]